MGNHSTEAAVGAHSPVIEQVLPAASLSPQETSRPHVTLLNVDSKHQSLQKFVWVKFDAVRLGTVRSCLGKGQVLGGLLSTCMLV
ncbi:hypothetical protein E2C01_009073 [Portunus trituberculatus]|uniref:Uncharacterized protein n=1 Tax=Portunus trituberculatus TaxID=210409 RepID=A0A5B7D2H5_PORTR|nr:hypothetical protein [Portunus trituberculatus]